MKYFVAIQNHTVAIVPPGAKPPRGCIEIDPDMAIVCELRNNQHLSSAQFASLRSKSPSGFRDAGSMSRTPQVEAPGLDADQPIRASAVRRSNTLQRANGVAGVVEMISWLFLTAAVVLGIVISMQARADGISGDTGHPFVAYGIGIAVFGAFQALVVIMVATYIQARTEP